MNKATVVNALAILFSMDTKEFKTELNKMSVKALTAMYNGYIKNAQAYQELEAKAESDKFDLLNK